LVGSGILPQNIRYQILDSSNSIVASGNNLTDVSLNFAPQYQGIPVVYTVKSGVINTINGSNGTLLGTSTYYGNGSQSTVEVSSYTQPGLPQTLTAVPSNQSIMVDCSNAVAVAGLDFISYNYKVYPTDNSANIVANSSNTSSLFYVSGLTNNVNYTVELRLQYATRNTVPQLVIGGPSSANATPLQAPPAPTGLSATYGANQQVILSWNYDAAVANGYYSLFKDGDYVFKNLPVQNNGGSLVPSNVNGNQIWSFTTSSPAGISTTYTLVASILAGGVTYVSSNATSITVVPYANPSEVQSLDYVPGNNLVDLSWDVPANPSGAGLSGNGELEYNIQLRNPNNGNNATNIANVAITSNLSYTINGGPSVTYFDASGNGFNLTNGTPYTVIVKSQFNVATGGTASSSGNTLVVMPKRFPNNPVLTVQALDTSLNGTKTLLNVALDPSCVYNTLSYTANKEIYDYNNNLLTTVSLVPVNPDAGSAAPNLRFTDIPINGGIGGANSSFLNGNRIEYYVTVTSTAYSTNYNYVASTNTVSVVPSGQALIGMNNAVSDGSFNIDLSGNVQLKINKNGANFNSLTVIGFGSDNTSVVVNTPVVNASQFNNSQSNGIIAAGQAAVVNISRATLGTQISKALAIFANSNTTAIADSPNGSITP
jgi:hypothetical protein